MTDYAEKEASEVLHSLLSVERIEKRDNFIVDTTTPEANVRWVLDAQQMQADKAADSDEVRLGQLVSKL